jgi:PAS domain S-box-containing protein
MSPGPKQNERTALRIDGAGIRDTLPQLIDALTDAVLVVDAEHRVVAANRRYLEVFGSKRQQITGARCGDAVLCPEAATLSDGEPCAACLTLRTRKPVQRIRAIPDSEGKPHRWEATFNPVLDNDGAVTHVVEVWRDISERSMLEAQLSHSERLAALGSLAAGVAHEINNPLASVLASVESVQRWLKRTPGIPESAVAEVEEVIGACEREIGRMHETTEKLMLLAQPVSVEPSWVNLNNAARDTISLLRYQMRKQQIKCLEELDNDLPDIWCREGGVRSICMNLMMNAVQAMPDTGRLMVRTRSDGDVVTLEIEDTGPGISMKIIERIWDPFFTTKPVGKGTGLGLSITRTLVERYGGHIQVRTQVDEGTMFAVELPRMGGPNG